ncbi:type II toxin-antitoxin system mRNA interferase toxin, RelE/StbE family [Treponema parvum]|nr:type II toxin-antitoxin system mRNA interferase toxin, RelE/StbE family [Treponema parvum]QTQ15426.1 type II toxin-antitoxin system mRNA interferase toxin, RelE/StbE family [Treponema parvum]
MKYEVKFTTQFKKDIKRAEKQNRNLNKLFGVIDLLVHGKPLEAKL